MSACGHDGDCGIQRDIRMLLGDWRYPKCLRYCVIKGELNE